jgi:hypothetical protein
MNKKAGMNFKGLVDSIRAIHENLLTQVNRAVNTGLTLRNWLIGYYISEYELRGEDRAVYGDSVLASLAERLKDVSNCNRRQLYRYLRFYRLYPQICGFSEPTIFQVYAGIFGPPESGFNGPTFPRPPVFHCGALVLYPHRPIA